MNPVRVTILIVLLILMPGSSLTHHVADSLAPFRSQSVRDTQKNSRSGSTSQSTQPSSNTSDSLLEKIAIGLLISLVTSYVTVRLSMRKFREETQWKLKSKAYTDILESLHHMKKFCAEMEEATIDDRQLSEDRRKQLNSKWRESLDLIELETDKGAFIIGPDAHKILLDFQRERRASADSPNWMEYLDGHWQAIDKCMNALRECAKRDLHMRT